MSKKGRFFNRPFLYFIEESVAVMKEARNKNKRVAAAYDWMEAAVFSLIVIVVVFTFLCRIVRVDGTSMQHTLEHNDRLLLFNINYEPERGDIVVITRENEEPLIKRVIAIAGDTVSIDEAANQVYVNGKALKEDYIKGVTVSRDFVGEQTVPEGCLFVLGDNRTVSHDSRSESIGFVSVSDVLGEATFRIWPIGGFGTVE